METIVTVFNACFSSAFALRELLLAKELENQKLLIQKEEEVHNKSLAKNQFIGELQGELGLKEKDALNSKIESLMKQLEFKDKELFVKTPSKSKTKASILFK
mgnify:CR=1 FL=1